MAQRGSKMKKVMEVEVCDLCEKIVDPKYKKTCAVCGIETGSCCIVSKSRPIYIDICDRCKRETYFLMERFDKTMQEYERVHRDKLQKRLKDYRMDKYVEFVERARHSIGL
jgi:transcription elongation factor Elf1